jgi:hypothetical protein
MKLKEFPLIMEGMRQIMLDQYMKGAFIKTEQEVPEWWEPRFKIAEQGLQKLAGRTLEQVAPLLHEMPGYEDLADHDNQKERAINHFYLPIDDLAVWLADAVGMLPSEYFFAQEIFEKFFDGVLRNVFQGDYRDGSGYKG